MVCSLEPRSLQPSANLGEEGTPIITLRLTLGCVSLVWSAGGSMTT